MPLTHPDRSALKGATVEGELAPVHAVANQIGDGTDRTTYGQHRQDQARRI
jgi:hypothetical protein